MINMWIGITIVLVVVIALLVYGIVNLLSKHDNLKQEYQQLDDITFNSITHIKNAYMRMKEVDIRGTFEADDEVGYAFQEMKEAIDALNKEYQLDDEEEEGNQSADPKKRWAWQEEN